MSPFRCFVDADVIQVSEMSTTDTRFATLTTVTSSSSGSTTKSFITPTTFTGSLDVMLEDGAEHMIPSTPCELDIGLYCTNNVNIPQQLKLKLLTEPWTPSVNYVFPTVVEAGRNRKFNVSWLSQFNWLAYSQVSEGAFCKHCVLFASRSPSCGTVGAFVISPLRRYKRAIEFMRVHEKSSFHIDAMMMSESFIQSVRKGISMSTAMFILTSIVLSTILHSSDLVA